MVLSDGDFQPDVLVGHLCVADGLHEYHLWAAAKVLAPELRSRKAWAGRRFSDLLAASALIEAVLLLASTVKPAWTIERVRQSGSRWNCSIRCAAGARVRHSRAEHADLATALLLCLLQSYPRQKTF